MAERIHVSVGEGTSNKYAIGMSVSTDSRGNITKVLTDLRGDLPEQSISVGGGDNNTASTYEGPPEYAARALANVKSIRASVVGPGATIAPGAIISGNTSVGVFCGDFAALMAEKEKRRLARMASK
jgi:hypothetical protein